MSDPSVTVCVRALADQYVIDWDALHAAGFVVVRQPNR